MKRIGVFAAAALALAASGEAKAGTDLAGWDLFVTLYGVTYGTGTVVEYSATGATVSAPLISGSGLDEPWGIAVSGSDLFVANNSTIGEYTIGGATVNAALVSGLANNPIDVAVSGNHLFETNYYSNTIGEYNATTGAAINASLVSGLNAPYGLAVSGNDLFVVNSSPNASGEYQIGEYTIAGATVNGQTIPPGGAINTSLISEPNGPSGIAVSGQDIFVVNYNTGTVGEYTTAGATVNASLITGLSYPNGIAVIGSDLFVANSGADTIGEYTTAGATVNASLVAGLSSGPMFIAAVKVPEPASLSLLAAGALGLATLRRRARR